MIDRYRLVAKAKTYFSRRSTGRNHDVSPELSA